MRQYTQRAREYLAQIPIDKIVMVGSLSALAVSGFAKVHPNQGKLLDQLVASDGTKYELRLHRDDFNYNGKLCYLLDTKNEKLHSMNHISTDLVELAGGTLKDGDGTIKFCGGDVVVLADGQILEIQQPHKVIDKNGKILETQHPDTD